MTSRGKGLAAVTLALLAILVSSPQIALAHFPATDGAMTVILHTDPDDAPVPGQPAKLFFDFDDTTGKFKLTDCVCNLSISRAGKLVYSAALAATSGQPSLYEAQAPYTFPSQGDYHITLQGEPSAVDSFQSFKLTWDLQVNQAPNSSGDFSWRTFSAYFLWIAGALAALGVLMLLFESFRARRF